jgi:CheY-like chemotaxis protein
LTDLPYGTPAIECWVPGTDGAASRLGVVQYLVKPISRDVLLAAVDGVGSDVDSVLLVDDEPEAVQLFARMLASADRRYRVSRAVSGARALDLLRERRPDLMLLDLIMPGMDGFQVLSEKARDPEIRDIPVVIVSSRDPSGEPIASDTLSVTLSGGLSIRDIMACIGAVSEAVSPPARLGGPERPGRPGG